MKYLLPALFLAIAIVAAPAGAAERYEAGVDYQVLDTPHSTSAPDGKVEVIEFFWYACPHCFALEPYLEDWLSSRPDNVKFVRVPVTVGFRWAEPLARAFYTEKVLGRVDQLHTAIFNEFHVKRHILKTEGDMRDFFEAHGVSGDKFDNAWKSFSVAVNMKKATNMQKAYKITGVPTVFVDGRYQVNAQRGTKMVDIIEFLVKKSAQ